MSFIVLPFCFSRGLANSTSTVKEISSQRSDQWSAYSLALPILLPLVGCFILWCRKEIFLKLWLQIDRTCISGLCPSLSQREKLLKWVSENLPCTWSSPSKTLSGGILDLWKDGSLLCTLINMAVPGACANPPKHWRKPPIHAQALAYKYLGIVPVFTESDFKNTLSFQQERAFLIYLQELQGAIRKYSEEIKASKFSSDYMTKGMGLQTGEQHSKTTFFIYTNATSPKCSNILIYIRGPYGTQGTATVPAFYNLKSKSALTYLQKQFKLNDRVVFKTEARKSFLKAFASDLSALVNLEKKISANDIPIQVEMEQDRAKISYIPKNYGIYEINMITNGELLSGSPFIVNVVENVSNIFHSFNESTEELVEATPSVRKTKILSRFIDCINEHILLETSSDKLKQNKLSVKIAPVSINEGIEKLQKPTDINMQIFSNDNMKQRKKDIEEERPYKLEKINEDPTEIHHERPSNTLDSETHKESEMKWYLTLPTVSLTESIDETSISSQTKILFSENTISEDDVDSCRNGSKSSLCDSLDSQDWNQVFSNYNSEEAVPALEIIQNGINETRITFEKKPLIVDSVLKNDSNGLGARDLSTKIVELKSIDPDDTFILEDNQIIASSESDYGLENFNTKPGDQQYSGLLLQKNLDSNLERPTSVVFPFLKKSKSYSLNGVHPNNEDMTDDLRNDHEKPCFLSVDSNSDRGNKLLTIFNEKRSSIITPDKNQTVASLEDVLRVSPYYSRENMKNIGGIENNHETIDIERFREEELQHLRPKEESLRNQYVDNLKRILEAKIHFEYDNSKVFKDFLNTTNKLKNLNKDSTSEKIDRHMTQTKGPLNMPTSPICSDHIASEVVLSEKHKYERLTSTEKRMFFARQSCTSLPSTNNSSISEKENEGVSNELEGIKSPLRVLSVIDTLKRTTSLNKNTSKSVPNISESYLENHQFYTKNLEKSYEYRLGFLKTKEYWSKLSSKSSSISSESYMMNSSKVKLEEVKNKFEVSSELCRSADDILSISRLSCDKRISQRYSSLNQKDFETIEFISLDERKRQLLQERYDLENLRNRFIKKNFRFNDRSSVQPEYAEVTEAEKWKKDVLLVQPQPAKPKKIDRQEKQWEQQAEGIIKPTTQFGKAISFFRKLEKSSSETRLPLAKKNRPPEIRRRLSLDFDRRKKGKPKAGGSLKLPKASEKFSITRLYFDIMGNRSGNFKGLPNKTGLSDSLGSLSGKNYESKKCIDTDDSIELSMFKIKKKIKRRKSIKSIFEVQ